MIYGKTIFLRAVRNIDVPKILHWENNPENWEVSETKRNYTFDEINLLIDSGEDFFENGQLRLMIVQFQNNETIGILDFFQTNFDERSSHVGILIANPADRRKGFALEALELGKYYLQQEMKMDYLYCSIQSFNRPSLELFKKCGFEIIEDENPIFDLKSLEIIKMRICLEK